MGAGVNRQILLVEKPVGKLGPEHFRLVETAVPKPKDGEALLRVRYISLDAASRAWMQGTTYRAALETNTVMAAGSVAEVIESKAPGLAVGDLVFGETGWQDYAAGAGQAPFQASPRRANDAPSQRLRDRRADRLFWSA